MTAAAWYHDRSYFARMYSADDDPWGFDDTWYEQRKHALTVAALPRARYVHGFEPGCANGALTELLQARCDRLDACDLLPGPVGRSRRRVAAHAHVTVRCAAFPAWWPDGEIDLLVLSEIAYYLTAEGRRRAEPAMLASLAPGADVVAVHYTGATDYPMTGMAVGCWLDGLPWLDRLVQHVEDRFEIGVWRADTDQRVGTLR